MTIVYVSDDNYAHLLGISLTSLYENNRTVQNLNVFIIDDGISETNRQKLAQTASKYNRTVTFFSAEVAISLSNMGKWPKNIFYRMFYGSVFEAALEDDRVLYLDCDTIVADGLQNLWDTDLNGKACAAVYECMSKYHKKKCCLEDTIPYFNSGVLLMDVRKWQELNIEERVRKILDMNTDTRMEYPDEGILNYLLKGNIQILDPKYNLTTIKCVFSFKELRTYRKSRFMYSEADYDNAINHPCIIHYTNNFLVRRPWLDGTGKEHPFVSYFIKYKDISEWKDIKAPTESIGMGKKTARMLYGINGLLCAAVTGFIYSYFKPLKYDTLVVN